MRVPLSKSSQSKAWKAREETRGKAKKRRYRRYGSARTSPALRLAVWRLVRTSVAMLSARMSKPSTQGNRMRKSNWSKMEPSCRQLSGRPSASMLRFRTSKALSNDATDAGIATLKTLPTRVTICTRAPGRGAINGEGGQEHAFNAGFLTHLVESDHLFERRANCL